MGSSARSRFLRRAAALGLGALLGLCTLELGVRLLVRDVERARQARSFDPLFGAVPRDSWIFDFHIDEARHQAVALRGQRVALEKPAGQTRVLVLGDSATEGAFVPREQAYPERLARLLSERAKDRDVVVLNAGVWGMTTIDELHLLKDKLLPLRPDVVVLGLFMANDINMNLVHPSKTRRYVAPALVDTLRRHSALAHLLYLNLLALNQRFRLLDESMLGERWVPRQIALLDARGLHFASYPAGELALYLREGSTLEDEAYAVLREALLGFRALARERGFALRVLLIPTPSSVAGRLSILAHPNLLTELRAQGIEVHASDLDFERPTRRVLALCEELGLSCIDPRAAMRKLGVSRAFFPYDEHPTAQGHEVLAAALASDQ